MNLRLTLAAVALSASTLHAQSGDLKTTLAQLDAANRHFKSVQADVKYDNYTRAVRADEISTGILYVEHASSGTQMGAIVYDLGPDGKPATTPSKILSYDGKSLQIFAPGVNQVDIFKAGANQAKYESFLTLGFGGSGAALAKSWNIQDQGPETIDGIKTENSSSPATTLRSPAPSPTSPSGSIPSKVSPSSKSSSPPTATCEPPPTPTSN